MSALTPSQLTAIASPLVGLLFDLAVKGTLLLVVGLLTCLLLARASAAARHLAWGLTFVALALSPAASLVLPRLTLPVLPAEAPAMLAVAPGVAGPPSHSAPATLDRGSTTGLPSSTAAETASAGSATIATMVGAVYLAGVALLAAWLAAGLVTVGRYTAAGRPPAEEERWRELAAALTPRLGLLTPVRLVVSERVGVPMVWGSRRPVVLLPPAAEGWSTAHRRDALLHELAHVRRGDWPVQLFAHAVCAVCWFHPLVWVALSRLRLEAERAADDRVLEAGASCCDYAERLVHLARGSTRLRPGAAVAMSGRSQLSRRIQALLDAGRRRAPLRRGATAVLAAGLLLPALVLGVVRLGAAAQGPAAADHAVTDPDPAASGRGTPLIRAALAGDRETVARLLDEGVDPDALDPDRDRRGDLPRSPLGAAARSGDPRVVEQLLDAGAEVDIAPRGDATPLMIAARHGHAAAARLLIDRGADVNAAIPRDGTPLISATRGGSREIVELLLEAGADPRAGSRRDGNPLIAAAARGDRWMVERLLAAGADPDAWVDGDESGWFHAVRRGDPAIVRAMLDAGADPNAVWDGDGTPLIVATRGGHREVVELLLDAGARPDLGVLGDGNALISAAASGDLDQVDIFLAAGADPDAAVRGDGNPLIAAAAGGHLEVVRRLVEAGADLDRIVPGDENPLIQAAGRGHLAVVRYLVESGADLDARVVVASWRDGREVRTPLSMARRGGHDEVVRYLQAQGATVER